MNDLDEMLAMSDPARDLGAEDVKSLVAVIGMRASNGLHAERRRGHVRIALPVIVAGSLALSGAAVFTPMVLGIGETNEWVDVDVRIPIEYETRSGEFANCEYGIYVRSSTGRTADDQEVADFLAAVEWTGVGQEVYEHALVHPGLSDGEDPGSIEWDEPRQVMAFQLALIAVVTDRLPAEMKSATWGSTDTCTGPFR